MIFQTFTYQIIADYFKLRQIKKGSEGIGKDEVGSSNLPSSSNLIPLKSYNFKGIFFFIRTFFTNMYFSKIGHFRRNPHRNPHGFFFRTEKSCPGGKSRSARALFMHVRAPFWKYWRLSFCFLHLHVRRYEVWLLYQHDQEFLKRSLHRLRWWWQSMQSCAAACAGAYDVHRTAWKTSACIAPETVGTWRPLYNPV